MTGISWLVSVTLALTACFSGGQHHTPAPPAKTPGCGDTVITRPGDTFSIQLRTPVATGYRWLYSDSLPGVKILSANPPTITADSVNKDGGWGKQLFTFQALKPVNGSIHFVYRRAFGGRTKYDDSCNVLLQVASQ